MTSSTPSFVVLATLLLGALGCLLKSACSCTVLWSQQDSGRPILSLQDALRSTS